MTDQTKKPDILSDYESESFIATQFRKLYYNIKLKQDGSMTKSLLVTSSNRGEGKSTIASLLGLTIARFPKNKVLVVDADLRRPRIHRLFNTEIGPGMVECLGEGTDPMQITRRTNIGNLHIITAGGPTNEPSKLFESEELPAFFKHVTFYYDVVIVDSAPVLAISDTPFLCTLIESVLFVILAGVTPREVVKEALQTLEDSHANVAGAILNNVMGVLPYYYDQKYYKSRE
jgi:capsular exopolysaccharide synthesis family protein